MTDHALDDEALLVSAAALPTRCAGDAAASGSADGNAGDAGGAYDAGGVDEGMRAAVLALCASLAPTLDAASGRFDVVTTGLLHADGPGHEVADEAEVELMKELQRAAGGRVVAVARAEAERAAVAALPHLLTLDRELLSVAHVYFDPAALRHWAFARNRAETGLNPAREVVAGIADAADVKQLVLTHFQNFIGLYGARARARGRTRPVRGRTPTATGVRRVRPGIMVGSFLMLFVPEACTAYSQTCSKRDNLGIGDALGIVTLSLNCVTAATFLVATYYFTARESWLIEWLDHDDQFPSTHLRHVMNAYPRIAAGLRLHNLRCATLSFLLLGLIVVNFAVSAGFVLRRLGKVHKTCCPGIFPQGAPPGAPPPRVRPPRARGRANAAETKTITTLITNTFLVLLRVRVPRRRRRRCCRA